MPGSGSGAEEAGKRFGAGRPQWRCCTEGALPQTQLPYPPRKPVNRRYGVGRVRLMRWRSCPRTHTCTAPSDEKERVEQRLNVVLHSLLVLALWRLSRVTSGIKLQHAAALCPGSSAGTTGSFCTFNFLELVKTEIGDDITDSKSLSSEK